MSTYPRVLVVSSDAIGTETGTGVTLANLFSDWPRDRIGLVYVDESEAVAWHDIQMYRVPPTSAPIQWAVRGALRGGKRVLSEEAPRTAAVPLSAEASTSARIHSNVRAALDLSPVYHPASLKRFIHAFRPDVVYSLLGGSRMIRLAKFVAEYAEVPLVPHFMDDWPSTLYTSGELKGYARRVSQHQLRRLVERSPVALCISEAMAEEYRDRFARRCEAFANPVEDAGAPPSDTGSQLSSFTYVGGLHLGRWESLLAVGRAVKESIPGGTLSIYAPQTHLERVAVPDDLTENVVLKGSLSPDEVAAQLRESQVLVHVESFDSGTLGFTRLSLSTKVPQYLIAGRPILAVGPPEQASMRVISASGGGIVVAGLDVLSIVDTWKVLADVNTRSRMGLNGRRFGLEQFERKAVGERFRGVLAGAAPDVRSAGKSKPLPRPVIRLGKEPRQ